MGKNGKHRWRISLHRSSHSSTPPATPESKDPPPDFLCPISGSLMADPVVISSGQTFERICVDACRNLGFSPPLTDGSAPDFSTVIPNLALKSTVLRWCDAAGVDHPAAPDYASAERLVRSKMPPPPEDEEEEKERVRVSEMELLMAVAERPPGVLSHAATELNHRGPSPFDSSSEESVVIGSPATPLPLATRPSCYSSASSSSSEILANETLTLTLNPEEEKIVAKLQSPDLFEQEEGAISLRRITRSDEEVRVSLCTPRLLLALKPLLGSRYAVLQTNAAAGLVNLSLEKANKVKIVRSGIVPPLVDALKGGCAEAQEHAAGALFSLAIEDDNKTAIGVLGALQPLLHALRAEGERARHDAAMALYHLSLVRSNRVKLVKLAAVPTLLAMAAGSGNLPPRVLLTLCNLASCAEGRSAMLDANAVECLVIMLRTTAATSGRGGEESAAAATVRENCVAALYGLSHGSMRFRGLAREARAEEVLREVEERGSERAREKARRLLGMLRGRDEAADAAAMVDGVLESSAASRTRYVQGGGAGLRTRGGPNSTEF